MVFRDSTRYKYKHAILKEGRFGKLSFGGGQRLSIMIRVLPLFHE